MAWAVNIAVDGDIVNGETVDISMDGVNVNCDDPLPMNDLVTLTIAPPDRDLIQVKARVIWADLDGIDAENRTVGMGMCFVEIAPEDQDFFRRAVGGDLA